MNNWSLRRKRIIFLATLLCLVILVGVPLFFFMHRAPTCTDTIMNGDESGVDCGGSCQLLCRNQSLPMLSKGDPRLIEVATSTFETVIVVQNPNISASVDRAGFTFKLFSATSSVPLKVIEGITFIPRSSTFALFEGPYVFEGARPIRSTFEWKQETLIWKRDQSMVPNLSVKNGILSNASTEPRLDGSVKNNSLENILNIELVALITDPNSNIIGASKTFVENLPPGVENNLIFTWPRPFVGTTTSVEILPRVLPDISYIR